MNWKITGRFIATVVSVAIIVIIINIIGGFIFILHLNKDNTNVTREIGYFSPENFTRNFDKYIVEDNYKVYVNNEGKKMLEEKEGWIQILDEEGNEVYSYKKSPKVKKYHTPMELINAYKYVSVNNDMSTIFISEKRVKNMNYSYIIGFPRDKIQRISFYYVTDGIKNSLKLVTRFILFIDIIIALVFGYLFSRRLTKPLVNIISDVKSLSEGEYDIERTERGVYKEVCCNVNNLALKLRSNEEERKKLDKMREEWISNISHDIKTPLVSVKGYAEILSNEEYDLTKEEIIEYSKIIESKSNYIKELIDDLNLSTRLKNKVMSLNLKNVNIVSLVRGVVIDILNNLETNNVDIDFSTTREVIDGNVDEILLRRVINNILYNAIVHNEKDVKIQVKIEKTDRIHIFIIDNGKGIKEEELKYIFERYYRGTNTGKKHKGSGLGMAIANDIVRAHGGFIKVESRLGEGTKTEIVL